MDYSDHERIADEVIMRLAGRGLGAFKHLSASGSAYVYVIGSRQKIRIADHGKHRGWFRYNIRTDLKQSRETKISGQLVFLFTETDARKLCFRVARDYKNESKRFASALVKQRNNKKGKKRVSKRSFG